MKEKVDDYRKFWNEIVLPDYDEYMAAVDDLRLAFHCASSLFHTADWLYWGEKAYIEAHFTYLDKTSVAKPVSSEQTFANAIRDIYPNFELLRGIANAGKHLQIKKGKHAASPISAANTYVTSTGYGIGDYGIGPYGGSERVIQEGPNDVDIEFTDLAEEIRDMWLEICRKHGFSLI